MPVKLNIDVTGDAPREIAALLKRAEDVRPAFASIGALMLRSVEKNFRAGGRPAWLPLSLTTLGMIARGVTRRKKGQTLEQARFARVTGKKILIDKGLLKNSITYQVLIDGTGVEIGTNTPYGRIHQLGGMAGRGNKVRIPARPFLLVQAEDEPRIVKILGHWIAKGEARE